VSAGQILIVAVEFAGVVALQGCGELVQEVDQFGGRQPVVVAIGINVLTIAIRYL